MSTQDNTQHNLGFGDLLRLSTRIFTVKPTRTLLTILGTSIGIATVVFLISLGYGLQYILLGKLITTQDSLITLQATYAEESNIQMTPEEVVNLSKVANVAETVPLAEFSGEIKTENNTGLALIRISDPDYFRLSGTLPTLGESFTAEKSGIVLTSQAIKLLGMEPDQSSINKNLAIKVFYQKQDGSSEEVESKILAVIGIIIDDAEPPLAYIPQSAMPKSPPLFKEVYIKAKDLASVEPLRDQLLSQGLLISARVDLVNQAQKILNIITIVLGVFGIAALTVSAVGMFNTMIVSFLERTYEVGVMKSLGAMDSDVRNLFLMESAIMGLAGGVSGVGMGMLMGQLFNLALNILAHRLGGESIKLFHTPTWFILLVLTSSSFIGLFAGFWPARRASGLSPKEAFLRK
ncbi:MAG: ABC transporter permease [Candidatus Doudnabacteria bacterium]|nr:ABC transporter permease [Candidatus Doudnabacteria bacterium]